MGKLKELGELAKEISDLAYEIGTSWENLTPNLKGYNAHNSNHKAADIFGIHVGLFSPIQYEFTEQQLDNLDETLKLAKKELSQYKKNKRARAKAVAEEEKQRQIAALEKRLDHLKGKTPTNKE